MVQIARDAQVDQIQSDLPEHLDDFRSGDSEEMKGATLMGQSIGWSRTGCKSTPNACAPLPQTTERIEIMERPGRRAEASQLSPSSLTVILSQRFPGIAGGIEVISDDTVYHGDGC